MKHSNHHLRPDSVRPRRHRRGQLFSLTAGMTIGGLMLGSLLTGALEFPYSSIAAISPPTVPESKDQFETRPHQGFAEIVKAVRPAVVHITASKTFKQDFQHAPSDPRPFGFGPDFRGRDFFRGTGMGSGVIVSHDGYVVTNNHVVEGAGMVKVTLPDKREFTGEMVGTDPHSDVAVIKIDGQNLPSIPWGDSSTLQVGDYVLAVGNPFGLNSTVTQGIVSALGRGGMGITQYEDFIQTDAAINPGNSGGALVNMRGELVGINTAILSRSGGYQGVGLAIPATMGKPIYESLVDTGTVERGYLGVGIQEITPDLAKMFHLEETAGALVTDVKDGSPANKAGISRGDAIVEFNGTPVSSPRVLQRVVTEIPVGATTRMTVIRDGQRMELSATIGKLHEQQGLRGRKG